MRSEFDFTNYIQNRLEDVEIFSDTQSSNNIEIDGALKTASKNQTGKIGYPDHIALVEDFVLVMEDKSDRLKLVLRDNGEISQTVDATTNYALNGALFYANKIIDATHYKKIFAFGNVGDRKHHIFKPIFIDGDKNIRELPEVDTFKNFTAENIESYYRRMVLCEESAEEIELKQIISRAKDLHEHLRNYGQLGEDEKPLVVSAILLALAEGKNFNINQLTGDKIKTDGAKIFEHVENHLRRANVRPEVKKERVLSQFRLIKDRPILNAVNVNLDKTPLKFFTEFISDKIFDAVINNSAEDYLGRFYGEFISYSGGDGQSLGVVLTPRHIAELFCELVDLKPDDIVFDPCCGTGSFLIAAMSHMLKQADDFQRKNIKQNQIHGIEAREDMFSIATTNMILRGDGQSNLLCGDFFSHDAQKLQLNGATVGLMNPPYSQAKNAATAHLSELRFINHLLNSVTRGGRVAVIVPVSAMIGKTRDDKVIKGDILRNHTLEGVISLNKNTFYGIGTVPCVAIFTAGEPHNKNKRVKFINFEDDGFEVKKHVGLVETERAKDKKFYLLDCWSGKIKDAPSKFMVETTIEPQDEWLHSFYYYNDEQPAEIDFTNTVADYLTFEFNMIAHGREYLFQNKKKLPPLTEIPPLESKRWKEFFIVDLFKIFLPSGDTQADKCEFGEIPLISAGFNNNGVCKFIKYGDERSKIYDGNIISVDMFGKSFVHEYKFYSVSHGRINLLEPIEHLNSYQLQFISVSINKSSQGKFSYNQMCSSKRISMLPIFLPVNDAGELDFDYMEAYISNIEKKIFESYREFISISPPPVKIQPLNQKNWRPFFIKDVAEILSGRDIYESERQAGDNPYIGASANNNGVCHFISNENETLEKNCISVNRNGSVGYAFYHPYAALYSNDCRKLRPRVSNEFVSIFIAHQITAQREKYNYGYKMGTARLNRQKIMLPVNDAGEPDFEYMEAYIRNIEVAAIKKVLEVMY
ncbi:MAG: N-6 DNA methylase [Selenomonadaceae bacterium]|nr:N-6 DNA methylase [Selenomonadaceae bacterium]